MAQLDRAARIGILGIGGLLHRKTNPPNRPKTVDSALMRDEIAQLFLVARALNPKRQSKDIVGAICDLHHVKRAYVYRVLKETAPERIENMRILGGGDRRAQVSRQPTSVNSFSLLAEAFVDIVRIR